MEWYELTVNDFRKAIGSGVIDGRQILESLSSVKENKVEVEVDNVKLLFDVRRVIRPLGQACRVFMQNGEYDTVKNVLEKYWKHRGVPRFGVDYLKGQGILKVKEIEDESYDGIENFVEKVKSNEFTTVRFSGDGRNIELQFLASRLCKGEKTDIVVPGLFVRYNGGVRVAPGVNRLVCSNGLTRFFALWEKAGEVDRLVEDAVRLAEWLVSCKGKKVNSVREVSVVLSNYPKRLLDKFWKKWAERVELNDLSWYDVIDDLTRSVNNVLNESRYRVLEVVQSISKYNGDECRCSICSSVVGRGK